MRSRYSTRETPTAVERRRRCDSSAVVALLDDGPDGRWAAAQLSGARLLAPSLLAFECSNIIRRREIAGLVSPDQAAQAHVDLLDLSIEQEARVVADME